LAFARLSVLLPISFAAENGSPHFLHNNKVFAILNPTNYNGDLGHGSCMHNTFTAQCAGSDQFKGCPQKYTFPYYYYDLFLTRVVNKKDVAPDQLETEANTSARKLCDDAPAKTWVELGSPPTVTWANIASIYKANAKREDMCWSALIIASGECQNVNGGCNANVALWQNYPACTVPGVDCSGTPCKVENCTPDESAQSIDTGLTSVTQLCKQDMTTVPSIAISAGNSNYIGLFCHANVWGNGPAWGGGMCTGGCIGTDPNDPQSCTP